jgi:hypothetical protein
MVTAVFLMTATRRLPLIGQNRVDFVGYGLDERGQEGGRCDAIGLFDELREGELRGAVAWLRWRFRAPPPPREAG